MKKLLLTALLVTLAMPAYATCYVNWMALTQPIKGDVLPMEGNAVADAETIASASQTDPAPAGAQYASVWCDAASTLEANLLSTTGNTDGNILYNSKEQKVPANIPVQIPNVIAGKTTITGTTF